MYTKLSIPERLKDLRVVDKHLTLEQLAEQTGLSKSALGKYESDDYKDISPFAIATLAKFYGVSTDYLMGVSENKNHPNTELQALHLSDAMVELLSSGKINNRLLCELATHPNFLRLMVDMEIFIDQLADMRVNQMKGSQSFFPVCQQSVEDQLYRAGNESDARSACGETGKESLRTGLCRNQGLPIFLQPLAEGRSGVGSRYGFYR